MKASLVSIAVLLGLGAYGQAHATCGTGTAMSSATGRCEIVAPASNVRAEAGANAQAGASSDSTAYGSSADASNGLSTTNRSMALGFPAAASAAPLPPGFCTQGTSSARGYLFNAYSKADSTSRLDTENLQACLDLARANRQQTPHEMAFAACQGETGGALVACVGAMMSAFSLGQVAQMASPAAIQQTIELKTAPVLAAPPAAKRKRVKVIEQSKSAELCANGWREVLKHCPKP